MYRYGIFYIPESRFLCMFKYSTNILTNKISTFNNPESVRCVINSLIEYSNDKSERINWVWADKQVRFPCIADEFEIVEIKE